MPSIVIEHEAEFRERLTIAARRGEGAIAPVDPDCGPG